MNQIIPNGVELICPICHKQFIKNDETKYVIKGGYTCSWKCFLKRVKDTGKERKGKYSQKPIYKK